MKIVIPFNPFYSILCFSLFNISFGLSENNEMYDKLQPPTNNKEGEIITEVEIDSNNIEVVENRSSPGVKPLMQEQFLNPNPQPYINTYQRQHVSTGEIKIANSKIVTSLNCIFSDPNTANLH